MMNAQPDGLTKWHRFVSEKDRQALAEALADDVLFRSPVLWKPEEGKATAMLYLSTAVGVLEDLTYQRRFVGDNAVVLERIVQAGAQPTSVVQLLCELQRDWARTETVQPVGEILFTLEGR